MCNCLKNRHTHTLSVPLAGSVTRWFGLRSIIWRPKWLAWSEMKCSLWAKDKSLLELCTKKEYKPSTMFIKYCSKTQQFSLKRSHSYYYQFQSQMFTTERSWCDFYVWTPRTDDRKNLSTPKLCERYVQETETVLFLQHASRTSISKTHTWSRNSRRH